MRNYALAFTLSIFLVFFLFSLSAHAAPNNNQKTAAAEADDRGLEVVEKNYDNRKRVALVIGNSSYRSSPLVNPANDAHAMASVLSRLGFEVEEKINLGYMEMIKSVENFGNSLRSGGFGLFYYAGHGAQVNGANYLIPVDAQIENENEVRFKAVDVGMVLAKMEWAKSDINLVVLDACRDNPFSRAFPTSSPGLADMKAPNGTFIAYATAPGKTAADGEGRNGLYTTELVKVLEIPGIPLRQVFERTLKAVREKSGYKQNPLVASNLEGEFYFIPPSTMTDAQLPLVGSGPVPVQPATGRPFLHDPATGMEFVAVPGGCFRMGDTFGDGESDEKPVHEVCLSDYYIGKFEVTQGQWRKVMGNDPTHFYNCCDDCPVDKVSWNDVQDFIRRLNSRTGARYRLPTESEWEYAAKSGGKNEKFSGGTAEDTVAWYSGNSLSMPHTVGQKQANGLGIHDMSGNMWEWVSDWYEKEYYGKSSLNNPEGPSTGTYRVLRGGSWGSAPRFVRTTDRFRIVPDDRSINLGFRLVFPTAR